MFCEHNNGAVRRRKNPGRRGDKVLRQLPLVPSGSESTGFSMVELLVCCALIGLLTLVCFRGLQGLLPAARVHRALGEVVELLEWARWSAVRRGCVYRVIVDTEKTGLTVFRETKNEEGKEELVPAGSLDLRQDHPGVSFGAGEGVVRTSGCKEVDPSGVHLKDDTVRFLPSGTPDRCGSLYLIPEEDLPDRSDRMRAVSILLATGRLQTWAYDPLAKSECEHDGAWLPL